MARLLPESLAGEIGRKRGNWHLYGARFTRSFRSDSEHRFGAWITIAGPTYSAEVELTARSAAEARRLGAALRRGGYAVGATRERHWFFARRPLHGMRELAAEVRHLEALVVDPEAVESLPSRTARTPSRAGGVIREPVLKYLKQRSGWVWSWAAVERWGAPAFLDAAHGWQVGAWCSLLVAPDQDPDLDLGAQVFRPDGDVRGRSGEFRRVRAAIASVLRPEGYRLLPHRRGLRKVPALVLLERRVRGLADARRARARLDELLFEG